MFLLRVKLITQGEKRETSTKTCNETMLRDKLRVFVSRISPPLSCLRRDNVGLRGISRAENGEGRCPYSLRGQYRQLQPGFHIVVPVVTIVSVASKFWKRQGRSYGNALAITRDDPGTILATETISRPR